MLLDNEIKLCKNLTCIISLRDDGHHRWRRTEWHHKVRHLPGVTGLAAWQLAIFYDIRCPSAGFLLGGSKVKGGFTRRGRTGGVARWHLLDVQCPSACFLLVSGRVKGGFITNQVSIVNRLLGLFIDDWLQFSVWNDCLFKLISSKYYNVS